MKLVSYLKEDHAQLAFLVDEILYDADRLHPDLPVSMTMFLNYWEDMFPIAHMINLSLAEGNRKFKGTSFEDVEIMAPVPHPVSCRIVKNRENITRPEFHFINHNNLQGPGQIICMPDHLNKLDFELQIAIVISKPCKNITALEADEYIGGYMIMNEINSVEMQAQPNFEKSYNFSAALGPILLTPDELNDFIAPAKENHKGNVYDLSTKLRINGKIISEGNMADMYWTFAEIVECCSYGVQLFPGDIISASLSRPDYFSNNKQSDISFVKEGDVVEMEISNLGILVNTIVKDESDYSLLKGEL